ncbi:MAG: 30S ribosomal protein S20 [Thermodesulfobacteriota bacterium]|nr:30S ribosomal protein S20 [Thermodesulfobacteriota bacterium]
MATHASAQKRARQSKKRQLRNTAVKSVVKTYSKKLLQAVEEKNLEEAQKALTRAIPLIQKASSKKVLHKKTAARKISRLTKKVNALAPKP